MSSNPVRTAPFKVTVEPGPDKTVVHCSGPLVAENTDKLKNAVKPLFTSTKLVQIDLAGVNYVDSAGLGAIVGLYTSARAAHSEMKLVNFNDQVRDLLHITNLLWVLA